MDCVMEHSGFSFHSLNRGKEKYVEEFISSEFNLLEDYLPKHHTIRAGHRFKVGDKFSPRVWSGNPYNSKQIIIAPDTEIVKVWDFVIKLDEADEPSIYLNGKFYSQIGAGDSVEIAKNDGLTVMDMKLWFKHPKPFDGQIIAWSDIPNY